MDLVIYLTVVITVLVFVPLTPVYGWLRALRSEPKQCRACGANPRYSVAFHYDVDGYKLGVRDGRQVLACPRCFGAIDAEVRWAWPYPDDPALKELQ